MNISFCQSHARTAAKAFLFACLIVFASLLPDAIAGNITWRVKNADSAAHSYCFLTSTDNGANWTESGYGHLYAGNTYSQVTTLANSNLIRIKWGDDQGAGSSNCGGNKPYLAMLD